MTDRDIVLIDMDCFYVQVEQRLNPDLKGKPCAVVQYKTWKGGGIIAVGYEARKFGVTRNMRGDDAKQKCPDIILARVPEVRGKADLTRYREAGAEVIAVFSKFCSCVERASVDEAFLDITAEVSQRMKALGESQVRPEQVANTFVEGFDGAEGRHTWLDRVYSSLGEDCERRLAVAASMVEEMRAAVLAETGFTCSAGIAHNKMLAKLACGRNKPNKQTVFPLSSVPTVFASLPIPKIRHLGGKLGAFLTDDLHLQHMSDLLTFTEQELQGHCGYKTGSWLYNACRGIELESVSDRELPKSIGCSKNFRGKEVLDTKEKVKFWLSELSKEVGERLEKDKLKNKRIAKSLTVSIRSQHESGSSTSSSRACLLARYDAEKICFDAYAMIKQFNTCSTSSEQWSPPLTNLGLSASKFAEQGNCQKISNMFSAAVSHTGPASGESCGQSDDKDLGNSDLEASEESYSTNGKHDDGNHGQATCIKLSSQKPLVTNIPKETSRRKSGIKLQNNHKDNFVSIKSFFSQKTNAENCIDVASVEESISNTDKSNTDDIVFIDKEETEQSKPVTSFGFFASKLKNLNSEPTRASACNKNSRKNDSDNSNTLVAVKSSSVKNSDLSEDCELLCDSLQISSDSQDPEGVSESTTELQHQNNEIECTHPCHSSVDIHTLSTDSDNTDSCKQSLDTSISTDAPIVKLFEKAPTQIAHSSDTSKLTTHCVDTPPASEDYMGCDTCGEFVSIFEMPEHTDFHFAQALQKEVNQAHPSNTQTQVSNILNHGQGKRKSNVGLSKGGRGGKRSKVQVKDKTVQPLTAFFTKS